MYWNLKIKNNRAQAFEDYANVYDAWYDKHEAAFNSEVEALRERLPSGNSMGIEIGVGTGRFAKALGIKEGIEPTNSMRLMAAERGIEVMNAFAEHLPYKDLHFDFVLMAYCMSYIKDVHMALKEAHRVLKNDGLLILGFIDKNSTIGKAYEESKLESLFHKHANFYSVAKVIEELKQAGFRKFEFSQTLFGKLEEITEFQAAEPGYGKGSYVVVKAKK